MATPTEYDVRSASVSGLLRTYRAILRELIRRGVARTSNAPTGDLAELLVALAVGGERVPNSVKSFDVLTKDGLQIQVKARVVARDVRGERQLSTIRSWDFTHLAVLLFGPDYSIIRVSMIPVEAVQLVAAEDRHVRGNRVIATSELLDAPGAIDLTPAVAAALQKLDRDYV